MCYANNERRKTTWQKEEDYQIKIELERSNKRKLTNTWVYWKRAPLNMWRWKKKKSLLRMRKLLETKLDSRNLKGINTGSVPLVRYSGPLLNGPREELQLMDQKTRKLMTKHKALDLRDEVDMLYVPRKEWGRELTSIQYSDDASIQQLEVCIKMGGGRLVIETRNNIDNTSINRTKWPEKIGRKATNKRKLIRENVDKAKKRTP